MDVLCNRALDIVFAMAMAVVTTVLQLLIPAKLLDSVYKGCSNPLKLVQMTASSQSSSSYSASQAFPNGNGWVTNGNHNQWLQVDLGKETDVKGISTQGRRHGSYWVRTYTISYSDDGTNFKPYKNNKVWNQLKNRQQKHVALRNQGHPTALFCKISVRRSKNSLEFSMPWRGEIISRWPFHSSTVSKAYLTSALRFSGV